MWLSFRAAEMEERFDSVSAGGEVLAIESCWGGSWTMALLATSVPST